jgi:hypothetical protein
MTPENFCYFLQGFLELSQHSDGPKHLNEKQIEEIKNHLKLVMTKVTPDLSAKGVYPVFPDTFPQVYCSTTDFSKILSSPPVQVVTCGSTDPTFLEQWKIDEEERKKHKKTQPYSNPNRQPGRVC